MFHPYIMKRFVDNVNQVNRYFFHFRVISCLAPFALPTPTTPKLGVRPVPRPFCIIVMMVAALYGTFMGTSIRKEVEAAKRDHEVWQHYYEKVKLEVAKEIYLRKLEGEDLGEFLPEDFDPYLQYQKDSEKK